MSILAKHYKLIDNLVISNNEKVTIDPDTPYTVVYLINDRDCAQITGIIRGVISGDTHTIVVIPLDAEDANFATIVNTYKITKINPYTFQAHFENFNNWIGVEVSEKSRIDLRVRYTTGESIVPIEQGNTYKISYVDKVDGTINLVEGIGKIKSIYRSTTKEALPKHINYFTNDTDYMLIVDFANSNYASDVRSINVIDIRSISLVVPNAISAVDKSELNTLILSCNSYDKNVYAYGTWEVLMDALVFAGNVNANATATQEEVQEAIKKLNEAIKQLKYAHDEYDLVEYDKETNTLYCHESPYQVVITGKMSGELNEIKYFTNFGTEKMVTAKRSLNVIWASSGIDLARRKPRPEGFKDFIRNPSNLYISDGATIDNIYLGHKIKVDPDDPEKVIDNSIMCAIKDSGVNNLFFGGLDTDHVGTGNKVFISGVAGATDFFNIYGKWHSIGEEEEQEDVVVRLKNNTNIFMGSCLDEESCMEKPESNMLLNITKSSIKTIYTGGINSYSKFNECVIHDSEVMYIFASGLGTESEVEGSAINISNSHVLNLAYIADGSIIHSTGVSIAKSIVDNITIGATDEDDNSTFITEEKLENGTIEKNKLMLTIKDGAVIDILQIGYSQGELISKDSIEVTKSIIIKNDNDGLLLPNEEALKDSIENNPDMPKK